MSERTPQQRDAIESRDRDVFLRAGAGTGKTSVLVERFCAAALDPDVGVENILAFTFTDRAADQLRRRVRETFSQLAHEADDERLESIREAERGAERAWISTIHGFCRRVLASAPGRGGDRPPLSRCRPDGVRPASPGAPSTPRSRSWSRSAALKRWSWRPPTAGAR